MKNFMDKDFLLSNEISKKLYHDFSSNMPIIDYHCHINPQEIAEDKKFENITQVWLGGDHYKWRQMRSNGVEEKYITGDATDREKFQKWAETLEKAIGNPLYHWSHLELQRYFGFYGNLNGDTAEEVWNICNEKLKTMSARSIMKDSNVELICTTDDPIDDLKYHIAINEDETFDIKVLPTWRPDKAIAIEKVDFVDYIAKLSEVSEIEINSFDTWKQAITKRIEFFNEVGCRISDHGLLYIPYVEADEKTVDEIFKKRLAGETLTENEELQYKTACMLYCGAEYSRLGWAMQLHFGVTRDNNTKMFNKLGVDTGFDGIYNRVSIDQLSSYLNALNKEDNLPKTILYSLNPVDNAAIGTLIGCFQEAGVCGKIQQGSAWWFNDHKTGMIEQMTSLANLGLLGNFIGMLTDSRSFLSYTRHEYFRRIMCELIGEWVANGEYPNDEKVLERMIKNISHDNALNYFGF